MSSTKVPISPSTGSGRVEVLDIFRGFALLGIYIVNIRFMSSSVLYPGEFSWMHDGTINEIVWWILQHFFNEKFFPIFSFLFGVGFGMQILKMEEKGVFTAAFFVRRYLILLLIGLIHIIFIWPGDILTLYALAGIILLLIRKVPLKYVLLLALIILLFPFYLHIRNLINQTVVSVGLKPMMNLYDVSYNDIVDLKTTGSFIEKIRFRLHEYSVYYRNVEYFPFLLSMIFTGYAAGKFKFYNKIPELLHKYKYVALAGLIFIFAAHFIFYNIKTQESFLMQITLKKMMIISNIFQAFLYLFIISWLFTKGILVKYLEPLTYAGRMSLTNYIMQSVIAVFIFRGFMKLYGLFDLVTLELIAIGVFSLLLLGSKLWLKQFKYGPLEWIWRQLSYKNPVTIKNQ